MDATFVERPADAGRPADATPAWRRWLGTAGAVVLGLVLLVAAWAKLLDPDAFAATIRAEGLDFLLPAGVVALVAIALEVGLGLALVLGVRRPWVLWPSVALVAFFLFLTGRAYLRFLQGVLPEDASCGCFGNLVERTPAEAFWQDLLLLVPPLVLAFLGRPRSGRPPLLRLTAVTALTAAATIFAWKAPELPIDDLATRLGPEVEVAELCTGSGDGDPICFDTIVPELETGEHLVILSALDEEGFLARIDQLNEHVFDGTGPQLWVVSAASEDTLFAFRFERGPAFEVREAPAPLLRPLYRKLPRSFRVRDGVVTDTFRGMPPLAIEGSAAAAAGSG